MKHVHAEVIKALADDMNTPVEELGESRNEWFGFSSNSGLLTYVAASPEKEFRIKPQTKAISWTNMYMAVGAGRTFSKRENAEIEAAKRNDLVATVEIRDDGTAHLHKVES